MVFLDAAAALDAGTLERLGRHRRVDRPRVGLRRVRQPYVTDALTIGETTLSCGRHVQIVFSGGTAICSRPRRAL
jgi:hypothetical protein